MCYDAFKLKTKEGSMKECKGREEKNELQALNNKIHNKAKTLTPDLEIGIMNKIPEVAFFILTMISVVASIDMLESGHLFSVFAFPILLINTYIMSKYVSFASAKKRLRNRLAHRISSVRSWIGSVKSDTMTLENLHLTSLDLMVSEIEEDMKAIIWDD
jgi:hypothetical protein